MAGLMTHYICGELVVKALCGNIQSIIKNNVKLYNIGLQGPDLYFYYLPGHLNINLIGLGTKMHKEGIQGFIDYLLNTIYKGTQDEQEALISYMCGFLCHYAVDCNTHPYIYYRSGFKSSLEKGTRLKFSLSHRKFETYIDMVLLNLLSTKKPANKKVWEVMKATKEECFFVSKAISYSIQKAYDVKITPKQVYSSFGYMTNITRFFETGRKRRVLMEFVENINITAEILNRIHKIDKSDFFNIKKSDWYFPWDHEKKRKNNSSFIEMYQKSIEDTLTIIDSLVDYLFNDRIKKEELLLVIGNNSLSSGIDASKNVKFSTHDNVYKKK